MRTLWVPDRDDSLAVIETEIIDLSLPRESSL